MHTIVRINVENVEEVLFLMNKAITPSVLKQEGCRRVQIYRNLDTRNELNIISEWNTEEDARNYFKIDKTQRLWDSLPNAHLIGAIRYVNLVYESTPG